MLILLRNLHRSGRLRKRCLLEELLKKLASPWRRRSTAKRWEMLSRYIQLSGCDGGKGTYENNRLLSKTV
jgi:hypothetical protein